MNLIKLNYVDHFRFFTALALTEISRYADRWTLTREGCTCKFDFKRQDCACCIVTILCETDFYAIARTDIMETDA